MRQIRGANEWFFHISDGSPNLRIRIALTTTALALSVLTTACQDGGGGPMAPRDGPPQPGATIRYTAVGASDVWGVGSSSPCLTPFLDCPDGAGYVFVAARRLRSDGFTVVVGNYGVPAGVISRRFQDLGIQYGNSIPGNFLDQLARFVPRDTTVFTVFAGANDVNVIVDAVGGGAGGANPGAYVDQQVRAFGEDLDALINGLRDRAESARIIVLNLPNLGTLPYLASASPSRTSTAQRASVGITTSVLNPLTSRGITVIDLMCDSRLYQPSTYSSDGFHPSDAGYAVLAGEVVRAITSGAYPAPAASCPAMSAVPVSS